MTAAELIGRVEEIVAHDMPDSHKLPRIASLLATFRQQKPEEPPKAPRRQPKEVHVE